MNGNNLLDLEKRKRIYDYILKYPGLNSREISKKLDIPKSTLLYHLNYLNKKGLIIEKNGGGCIRYFVSNKMGVIDEKLFAMLRKRIIRHILIVLASYRVCTQAEIVKYLKNDFNIKKHPTTIAFHLDKLIEMGVVECVPNGREKIYVGNYRIAHVLIDFVIKHKISFLGDRLLLYLNKLNKPSPTWLEKAEEVCYDIFPHPYHV
jgi:predicted transcriptional regulator